MLLFFVTSCLVVTVQPCMDWIPIKKNQILGCFLCSNCHPHKIGDGDMCTLWMHLLTIFSSSCFIRIVFSRATDLFRGLIWAWVVLSQVKGQPQVPPWLVLRGKISKIWTSRCSKNAFAKSLVLVAVFYYYDSTTMLVLLWNYYDNFLFYLLC